jgi:hypothetical protein
MRVSDESHGPGRPQSLTSLSGNRRPRTIAGKAVAPGAWQNRGWRRGQGSLPGPQQQGWGRARTRRPAPGRAAGRGGRTRWRGSPCRGGRRPPAGPPPPPGGAGRAARVGAGPRQAGLGMQSEPTVPLAYLELHGGGVQVGEGGDQPVELRIEAVAGDGVQQEQEAGVGGGGEQKAGAGQPSAEPVQQGEQRLQLRDEGRGAPVPGGTRRQAPGSRPRRARSLARECEVAGWTDCGGGGQLGLPGPQRHGWGPGAGEGQW